MKTQLPEAISSYYTAANAGDAEATVSLFAADGSVRDEHAEHRGLHAIREWIADVTRKYGAIRIEPTEMVTSGDATVVTTLVSGSFKGSPVTLRYSFVLRGTTIELLEIT